MKIPEILTAYSYELEEKTKKIYPLLAPAARKCFLNTAETTINKTGTGDFYVITGDIPAMWLRDSAAQVNPYMKFAAEDKDTRNIIKGIINRYVFYINHDPYANAFNEEANDNRYDTDETDFMSPYIWERKYETDSLCAAVYLIYDYFITTSDKSVFLSELHCMLIKIIDTFTAEQNHERDSSYYFIRKNCPETDTIPLSGKGNPAVYTGMTWSGFRPSDDRCIYNYLIPSNMMACTAMKKASYLLDKIYKDKVNSVRAIKLSKEIKSGIYEFGVVDDPEYGKIFAYETDGSEHHILMDDANSPSLLSAPYIGFCDKNDTIYQNTRRFILSDNNPYYFSGSAAKGIGSPHTGKDMIWPISIIMQILTSGSKEEITECLDMLAKTHNGTYYMHEAFDKNNPSIYTRPWFAWANSLFSEMLTELQI